MKKITKFSCGNEGLLFGKTTIAMAALRDCAGIYKFGPHVALLFQSIKRFVEKRSPQQIGGVE